LPQPAYKYHFMTNNLFQPLHENCFYHIYNRGNNGDNIFYKHENYNYFLRKYDQYLSDYLETYAYSLLPNHFHLLVRVKDKVQPIKTGTKTYLEADKILSEAFRRFFTSYAKSINEQQGRTGSLFQKNFKRKLVDSEVYFTQLIYYIHANAQNHGIIDDFKLYPYSSYGRILLDTQSKLFKKEVLEWFGSKDAYIDYHAQKHKLNDIRDIMIEEL